MKAKIISAALVAIGLLALGLCIRSGVKSFSTNSRVVSVRGLSEREVKANKVTWPIVYKILGNDLNTVYNQMESSNSTIVEYLTSNGVAKDEIMIEAPSLTDAQANQYTSDRAAYRYVATVVLTVTSNDVDKVVDLINRQGELLKKGITLAEGGWSYQTIFEYTALNDIKPDMIAEATRNARDAAQKFADDSGSRLGKIKSAQQGQFSIEDRDPYTPSIKNVRVVTYIDYIIED
ncbi:MAG: SIMPL domain-containing protein [Muribaculaceae bacterium]|nr:SIMPL domain-containing protein [Muribaculaceae bacterium]